MSLAPRCPWCRVATELEPCCAVQDASDRTESFEATHRCKKCHGAFKHTPGTWSSTRPEVEAVYTEG